MELFGRILLFPVSGLSGPVSALLFHHLTSIASYVRMNDETKGQKHPPDSLRNKFKTAS